MSKNRVIGNKGKIPWNMPADMRFFKKNTENKAIVMGRKTYEGLPKKPLPNRTNIILTRDIKYKAEGCIVVHSTEEAIKEAIEAGEAKDSLPQLPSFPEMQERRDPPFLT